MSSVRDFLLERLSDEEWLLPDWSAAVRKDVEDGLSEFRMRQVAAVFANHADYRDEWRSWSHEADCDCERRCRHLPDEVCERCSDG